MALSRATTSCLALARGLYVRKHIPVLYVACRQKSDLPPPSALSEAPISKATPHPKHPDVDLTFENAREAYRSKTTGEIVRALLVFNLCSVPSLVDNQRVVLKWARKILGKTLFVWIMKKTFYGHFVAGENLQDIKPLIIRNRSFGVKSILDYSVEEDLTSEEAKEIEMKACVSESAPAEITDTAGVPIKKPRRKPKGAKDTVEEKVDETPRQDEGAIYRYRAHEDFGDRREGVVSARTYFYEDEAQCDRNMAIFKNCIDAVSYATEGAGFAAIKLTALGRPQLLLQMSEVLMAIKNFYNIFNTEEGELFHESIKIAERHQQNRAAGPDSKWISVFDITKENRHIDLLDWDNLLQMNHSLSKIMVVPNLKTGKVEALVTPFTEEEEFMMKNMLVRINTIIEYAAHKNVRVMIDAEQTYFQAAISRLAMEMMRKFNKEKALVFNTYQCYLKDALNSIKVDLELARTEGFYFGAKIVRGAYMEQERERASTLGYEDPINPKFEATTEMYYSVVDEILRQIHLRPIGEVCAMMATHNEDTVRYAVEKMKECNVGPEDKLICFGQLLGMCDQMSFPLGQAGYSVYKYVPYGPVEEVLPYLGRRAMENKGILAKISKEKRLLRTELVRRLKSGQVFYNPEANLPV